MEVPETEHFEAYVDDVEYEGDDDTSNLTGGLKFGHQASIRVHDDQPREICSTARLLLPRFVFHPIFMAVSRIPTLSDPPEVYRWVRAIEVTVDTIDESMRALKSQIASKGAAMVAKAAQIDRLQGCHRIAEYAGLLVSATIRKHDPQLHASRAVTSNVSATLKSTKSQFQVYCASKVSPSGEMDQLQSGKNRLEEQYEVGARQDTLYKRFIGERK